MEGSSTPWPQAAEKPRVMTAPGYNKSGWVRVELDPADGQGTDHQRGEWSKHLFTRLMSVPRLHCKLPVYLMSITGSGVSPEFTESLMN